jgi:hypothetical protein
VATPRFNHVVFTDRTDGTARRRQLCKTRFPLINGIVRSMKETNTQLFLTFGSKVFRRRNRFMGFSCTFYSLRKRLAPFHHRKATVALLATNTANVSFAIRSHDIPTSSEETHFTCYRFLQLNDASSYVADRCDLPEH